MSFDDQFNTLLDDYAVKTRRRRVLRRGKSPRGTRGRSDLRTRRPVVDDGPLGGARSRGRGIDARRDVRRDTSS